MLISVMGRRGIERGRKVSAVAKPKNFISCVLPGQTHFTALKLTHHARRRGSEREGEGEWEREGNRDQDSVSSRGLTTFPAASPQQPHNKSNTKHKKKKNKYGKCSTTRYPHFVPKQPKPIKHSKLMNLTCFTSKQK